MLQNCGCLNLKKHQTQVNIFKEYQLQVRKYRMEITFLPFCLIQIYDNPPSNDCAKEPAESLMYGLRFAFHFNNSFLFSNGFCQEISQNAIVLVRHFRIHSKNNTFNTSLCSICMQILKEKQLFKKSTNSRLQTDN